MTSAGVVLSHPPSSTAPSNGYEPQQLLGLQREQVPVEHRRVGFWNGSLSEIAGTSNGNPPACQTPRLTSSARARRCVWHGLTSLHVLTIAITGLPAKSSRS